jgi:prepilin-type N-terminal cleavage/methylation domain-containing protein
MRIYNCLQFISHAHSKNIMKVKINLYQAKSRRAFTLVEMLVVIGMIAALAGISFPVYNAINNKVAKQQLLITMNAIEVAVNNFETEYTYLPFVGETYPTGDIDQSNNYGLGSGGSAEIDAFYTVLAGTQGTPANYKEIKFLEINEPKGTPGNYKDGLLVNNDGSVVLYNPWGNRYEVVSLDTDLDGEVHTHMDWNVIIRGKRILITCYGPDGVHGGGGFGNKDKPANQNNVLNHDPYPGS